jgi:hypothetical protein
MHEMRLFDLLKKHASKSNYENMNLVGRRVYVEYGDSGIDVIPIL